MSLTGVAGYDAPQTRPIFASFAYTCAKHSTAMLKSRPVERTKRNLEMTKTRGKSFEATVLFCAPQPTARGVGNIKIDWKVHKMTALSMVLLDPYS